MNVPKVRLSDIVEVLRAADAASGPIPTVTQVRILIDDIWQMRPLEATAARPEMEGLGDLDLISIAEHMGKHRARVMKKDLTGKRARLDAHASTMLFPPTEDEVRRARALLADGIEPFVTRGGHVRKNTRHAKNPQGFPAELFHALPVAQAEWGSLPAGYERGAGHGRDVHGSLAAVLAEPVTEAEIIRFVDRTYSVPTLELDADHVQVLHWLITNGLELKLLDLVAKAVKVEDGEASVVNAAGVPNIPLAKAMVAAYDLLEVARCDAVRSLARVVRGEVTEPEQIRKELAGAQWLSPGPIGKLVALADRVLSSPNNERLEQILASQVATFRNTVRTQPDAFVVRSVSQMSAAHLAQVLTLSGMVTDDAESKAASNELRTRLIEMGLRNDLDRELPEALRAWRSGRLEEFYASRQARVEGDPDWARLYDMEADLPVDALAAP